MRRLPASVDMMAQPGGIFVSDAATSVTITETSIQRNVASMTNTVGDATAFAGGINVWGVDFEMTGSIVSNNHVRAVTLGNSRGDASGDGGGAELVGTIIDSRISGNTVTARSKAGDAIAAIGGLLQDDGSLVRSTVSGNELHAFSPNGSVSVFGAGITVGQEPLTVRRRTWMGTGRRVRCGWVRARWRDLRRSHALGHPGRPPDPHLDQGAEQRVRGAPDWRSRAAASSSRVTD